MKQTVTVAIGRNVQGGAAMNARHWRDFRADVYASLRGVDAEIISETSGTDAWGEETAVFVASLDDDHADYSLISLRRMLYNDAHRWEQEAIALTIGATEFVGPDSDKWDDHIREVGRDRIHGEA